MDIKPIRTEADYQATLREIESLMTAKFGTPEGDRLDVLATLVEAYEAKHFSMEVADPVEAIKKLRWTRKASLSRTDHRPLQSRVRGAQPNSPFDTSDDLETAQGTWHTCRGTDPAAQACWSCLIDQSTCQQLIPSEHLLKFRPAIWTSSGHQHMRQARFGIDADVGLHTEDPVVTFL